MPVGAADQLSSGSSPGLKRVSHSAFRTTQSELAAALDAYRATLFGGILSPSARIVTSFKIARALEKLKRMDEAIDQYYTQVVLAYLEGRTAKTRFDDDARAAFSKAAFRLADEFESRGRDRAATGILELVVNSGVHAADEARRRIERLASKGMFK